VERRRGGPACGDGVRCAAGPRGRAGSVTALRPLRPIRLILSHRGSHSRVVHLQPGRCDSAMRCALVFELLTAAPALHTTGPDIWVPVCLVGWPVPPLGSFAAVPAALQQMTRYCAAVWMLKLVGSTISFRPAAHQRATKLFEPTPQGCGYKIRNPPQFTWVDRMECRVQHRCGRVGQSGQQQEST
jgi:hypothetical protein